MWILEIWSNGIRLGLLSRDGEIIPTEKVRAAELFDQDGCLTAGHEFVDQNPDKCDDFIINLRASFLD